MIKRSTFKSLKRNLKGDLREKENLKFHTSLKVGGIADYFLFPKDFIDIKKAISFARKFKLPWMVLGNGTNILFPDEGYRGVVICTKNNLTRMEFNEKTFRMRAGADLKEAIRALNQRGIHELDFLAGIPGTVGGALVMNAGIPNATISGWVSKIKCLDPDGKLTTYKKNECRFGNRYSIFQEKNHVLLEGEFNLRGVKPPNMKKILKKKRMTQPLKIPSPGCVFKNPTDSDLSAGQLLDKAGLKGYRIGKAAVSDRHANFIINLGGATAKNILKLVDISREKVYSHFGIELELELKVV